MPSQLNAQTVQPDAEYCSDFFRGLSGQHLQHIFQQVKTEGFYIESQSILCDDNFTPSESVTIIEFWAKRVGLKVSFNHEHQLCIFESL